MRWAYTVVYSGNVEADTEGEAEATAWEVVESGLAASETCDVEPIGETDAA